MKWFLDWTVRGKLLAGSAMMTSFPATATVTVY